MGFARAPMVPRIARSRFFISPGRPAWYRQRMNDDLSLLDTSAISARLAALRRFL